MGIAAKQIWLKEFLDTPVRASEVRRRRRRTAGLVEQNPDSANRVTETVHRRTSHSKTTK
jgi:hypothetical protein